MSNTLLIIISNVIILLVALAPSVALWAKVSAHGKELDIAKEQVKVSGSQIDVNRQAIEVDRAKLDTAQAAFTLQQTEARFRQLDRDLNDAKEREIRTTLDRVSADAGYKAQISALNDKLTAMQVLLNAANTKIDVLTSQNTTLQSALDTASTEIFSLRELLQKSYIAMISKPVESAPPVVQTTEMTAQTAPPVA